MKEHENIGFVRKPHNKEYLHGYSRGAEKEKTSIAHKIKVSPHEYDEFVKAPLMSQPFLKGHETAAPKNGAERGAHEVSAKDRPKLYVDPQGYDYGRYVGMKEHEHPYWSKK